VRKLAKSSSNQRLERNPKFEARNPKQAQKFKISMLQTRILTIWNFGFALDFDIRISNFVIHLLGPAIPG
jgi:hypothetical protein